MKISNTPAYSSISKTNFQGANKHQQEKNTTVKTSLFTALLALAALNQSGCTTVPSRDELEIRNTRPLASNTGDYYAPIQLTKSINLDKTLIEYDKTKKEININNDLKIQLPDDTDEYPRIKYNKKSKILKIKVNDNSIDIDFNSLDYDYVAVNGKMIKTYINEPDSRIKTGLTIKINKNGSISAKGEMH